MSEQCLRKSTTRITPATLAYWLSWVEHRPIHQKGCRFEEDLPAEHCIGQPHFGFHFELCSSVGHLSCSTLDSPIIKGNVLLINLILALTERISANHTE